MAILARANAAAIDEVAPGLASQPHHCLRKPETGMIMVRGRIGGTGDAFNMGEASVTRCSIKLPCGTVGHAYILGRCHRHAQLAAIVDALLQTEEASGRLFEQVIEPLRSRQQSSRDERRNAAAATRVEFFTMVRGDD